MKSDIAPAHLDCVLEGMISFRSVVEGIRSGVNNRKIKKVLFDEKKVRSLSRHLSYIKAMSYEMGFELVICPSLEIEKVAVGNTHGGIVTVCSKRSLPSLSALIPEKNGFYMLLDGIEDPYNLGCSLRSLYAAGVSGVVLPPKNRMDAAGIVCRSSAGAAELMPVFEADPKEAFGLFKNYGYKVVCADKDNAVSAWESDLSYPIFIIVGGEKRGISPYFLQNADSIVKINYKREFNAALSTASAASVLAFEILRQNS